MPFMRNKRANAVNDRPFSKAVLAKARKAVEDYRFAFWREDGRFVAQCVELDTLGVGATSATALAEARALAITSAAVLIESRKRLPLPAISSISHRALTRITPSLVDSPGFTGRAGGGESLCRVTSLRPLRTSRPLTGRPSARCIRSSKLSAPHRNSPAHRA